MGATEQAEDFSRYVAQHKPSLASFAFLVCGSALEAEDLLQEVLAKAYLKWDRITAPGMDTRAYLNRMIVNERNSLWRRAFRRRELSVDHPPEEWTQDHYAEDSTWDEVLKLPLRQRQVVALRYYADLDVAQTAAVLHCSEGTVKSQTHHAITALRAALSRESKERDGVPSH